MRLTDSMNMHKHFSKKYKRMCLTTRLYGIYQPWTIVYGYFHVTAIHRYYIKSGFSLTKSLYEKSTSL